MVFGRIAKKLAQNGGPDGAGDVDFAEDLGLDRGFAMKLVMGLIIFRVLQRVYYFARGHRQHLWYNPSKALERWFKEEGVTVSNQSLLSTKDGVLLKYRRIGSGKRLVLLANGVGTALYMWVSIFSFMLKLNPELFEGENGITIIAPCYRGLFGSCTTEESKGMLEKMERSKESVVDPNYAEEEVDITMKNCADDIKDILAHVLEQGPRVGYTYDKEEEDPADVAVFRDAGEDYKHFEMVIGWSMGAQCILSCLQDHPFIAKKLFLLNPSSGRSLHTAFQVFFPLPFFVTKTLSSVLRYAIVDVLRPTIRTNLWLWLKAFAESTAFRVILEFFSFWAGFPPEQGVYFHAYMVDVFSTRGQTRGLLDLIVALDSPLENAEGTCGGYGHFGAQKDTFGGKSEQTVIVSGLPDCMTGVYHASLLANNMHGSRTAHKVYSMGSHFLLLEWPDMVAADIMDLLDHGYDSFLRDSPSKPKNE